MQAEFESQLTAVGYLHEIMADFGEELSGVFDKKCIDRAITFDNYAYDPLTPSQLHVLEKSGKELPVMYLPIGNKFKPNLFRVMGVNIKTSLRPCAVMHS